MYDDYDIDTDITEKGRRVMSYRDEVEVPGVPNQVTAASQLKKGRKLQEYGIFVAGQIRPYGCPMTITAEPSASIIPYIKNELFVKVVIHADNGDFESKRFLADMGIMPCGTNKKWHGWYATGFVE